MTFQPQFLANQHRIAERNEFCHYCFTTSIRHPPNYSPLAHFVLYSSKSRWF